MRIGEIAARFNIPRHHLLYWKKTGLIKGDESGNLSFADIKAIQFIQNCKKQKISVKRIRSILKEVEQSENLEALPENWVNEYIIQPGMLLKNEGDILHEPTSGQIFFNFDSSPDRGRVLSLQKDDEGRDVDPRVLELEKDYFHALSGGNPSVLKKILKSILELEGGHVGALVEMGNLYFESEKLTQALEYYEKALEVQEDIVEAIYNIANIYFRQKKFAASIRYYERCIELDPEFPESYYNLGVVYYSLKYYEKAEYFLIYYTELDPDSFWSEQADDFLDSIEQMRQNGILEGGAPLFE